MIEQSIPWPIRKRARRRMETRASGVPIEQVESLIWPENVERERLLELFDFISEDGPSKPPQMDTVGSTRLSLGGFTSGEVNYVFDQFAKVTGQEVVDDDRTYYALSFALRVVLSQ